MSLEAKTNPKQKLFSEITFFQIPFEIMSCWLSVCFFFFLRENNNLTSIKGKEFNNISRIFRVFGVCC